MRITQHDNIFTFATEFFDRTTGVFGWINYEDVVMFSIFNRLRSAASNGDILEIGTHMGKTAVLLGTFLRDSEFLSVCDIFEKAARDQENKLEVAASYRKDTPSLSIFKNNYRKFHHKQPVIYNMDSLLLADQLRDKYFRFIHIDGGHTFNIVSTDLKTAIKCIKDDGVIAIDDWQNYNTIDVAAVFWKTIMGAKLRPILLTHAKAYFSKDKDFDLTELKQLLKSNGIIFQEKHLFDQKFILISPQLKNKKFLKIKKMLPPILYSGLGKLRNRK